MNEIIIIGAGITGLSCAYYLKKPYAIMEKEKECGGLCRSVRTRGFTFDYSGHFLHVHHKETENLIKHLLKNNLQKISRNSWIFSHNRYIPFPFQANLYALPEKITNECLQGFINKPYPLHLTPYLSFYDWSVSTFGKGITKHFMKPYNEKLWTISSRQLSSDWVAPFVPHPSAREIVEGSKHFHSKTFGYNVSFYYPKQGGIGALIDAISSSTKNLRLNSEVTRIDYKKKFVETSKGERFYYNHLVSTQPLPELLKQMSGLPSDVITACTKLKWNSVYCLNIDIKKSQSSLNSDSSKHWIYFPENKFVFYRAGIYTNISPLMAPDGFSSMYVEISRKPEDKINLKKYLSLSVKGLRDCSLISQIDKIELINCLTIPYAYVIYDKHRKKAVEMIQNFLKTNNIYSIGRYGAWEYSFMEKSIIDGRETACLITRSRE